MKTKALKIINLIVAVLVSVFALGHAFAWLVGNRLDSFQNFNGSSGSPYFESGDGLTEKTAFVITNQYHLYNLAWLQNTGKFDKQYYFKVDNDISIDGNFWLPPIGTDDNPFEGIFNGNGNKIKNLQVTTNSTKLTGVVSGASVKYSNAVGMFGMTDAGAEISNFILEKPVVDVANANAVYSASANKVAGLAVGHVAKDSKVSSIGVLAESDGAQLLINKGGYSTFNSIIGELAEGVESSVTGGGHTSGGGSGANFGSSLDVDVLLNRLNNINTNKKSSTPSWRLPELDTDSQNPVVVGGESIPFSVTEDSTYTGSSAAEVVADNNVGYFTGNQNKINSKKLTFTSPMVKGSNNTWTLPDGTTPTSNTVPNWFYKIESTDSEGKIVIPQYNYTKTYTGTTGNGFNAMSQEEYATLPDSIKQLLVVDSNNNPLALSSATASNSFTTIRLQAQYWGATSAYLATSASSGDGNAAWAFHGQISWMGNNYGEGFRYKVGETAYAVNADGKYLDINGNVLTSTQNAATFNGMYKGVPLPSNAIWFKPAEAGKIRLVLYSESSGDGFALVKCTRTQASANDPFSLNFMDDMGDNAWQSAYANMEYIFLHQLPEYALFYYEYELTTDDMVNGTYPEFFLSKGNTSGGGAYFVYLDIGASGTESGDTGAVDHEKAVSAVDFIYNGVSIAQSDEKPENPAYHMGDFIVTSSAELYEATKTSIYFENYDTVLQIVFLRKAVNEDKTMQVTVTGTTDNSKVTATNTGKVDFTFNA